MVSKYQIQIESFEFVASLLRLLFIDSLSLYTDYTGKKILATGSETNSKDFVISRQEALTKKSH